MICDVCGRDNADTLTFCQDCGRRLRAPRVVAPTPPNGLAKVELPVGPQIPPPLPVAAPPPAPREEAPSAPPVGGPASPRRSRPEVPVFSFKPASEPPIAVSSAPVPQPPMPAPPVPAHAATNGATVLCGSCNGKNPADYRYCVTCGAVLKRSVPPKVETLEPRRVEAKPPSAPPPAPPPAPAAPPPPIPLAQPAAPAREEKIVGAPVVDIASTGQAQTKFIICARCHGSCVAGTRFCKYCGAPLDGRAALPPPEPALDADPPDTRPTERRIQDLALRPLEPKRDGAQGASNRNVAPAPAASSGKAPAAPTRPGPAPYPGQPPREDVLEALPSINELPEPGRRLEISQLAGSPIPSMPVPGIPSPGVPSRSPAGSPGAGPSAGGASALAPAASGGPARRLDRKATGRLVVIVEDGSEGRSFSLGDGQLDIGRVDGDIILEDDHYVSPRHARLRFVDGRWILRDLDSTNHVYVRLRRPHPLRDGDLLLLGLEVLQFQTVSDGERGLGHAMQHGTLLFGSPATPRRARLCQRTVEGVIRDVYHLFRDETVIGRETGDIVFTADPFLSRRHAAIRRSATTGEFTLTDLDSSNGTYVALRGEVGLSNGDYLRIGQHLFRVDLG